MNARFIQGIFDDASGRERYTRWGRNRFDPDANTDELIAALPEWYRYGLRAFTVGLQGGGPCFTINNDTIENNPFGTDGTSLDAAYKARLDRLIRAADELGMVVIVSYFYGSQSRRIRDGRGIRNAVITASRFLRKAGHTNVIIEVANEQDNPRFSQHPIIQHEDGMAMLIDLAREESGGMLVGCSGNGGRAYRQICEASDVVLIHGNGQTRQQFYNLIRTARAWSGNKPIVCNEDSQAIGQLEVCWKTHASWGYYNNMTKQEPPAYWGVLPGEDTFFAMRMAHGIGIEMPEPAKEEQYYLQGLEPEMVYRGKRWIRLASLYPETINHVDYYRNGNLVFTSYDEPFSINFGSNWAQGPVENCSQDEQWRAEIHLRDGSVLVKQTSVSEQQRLGRTGA
ncbi:MAG: hypothetical protein GF418_00475 [Chitinivibrionales bacterium]|nr:hypothetical protein [Chitinivibrionales bacterium]MBD3394075.1 hypothetical protein [Chitinivibrionales bacterium]